MIKKVSIIGSGAVGSTLAFQVLSRLTIDELSLLDIAADLARGVALDLEDTRSLLGFSTRLAAGNDYAIIDQSDIVIVTAGIARKEGMSRADLLKINAAVARDVAHQIRARAPGAIVVAVTNPLDIITYIIARETGFPRQRILGMGASLDTARLLGLFSHATGCAPSALGGFAFGPHSNEMIVSGERLRVQGEPVSKFLSEDAVKMLQERTALRGGEIVGFLKNRSASFAPSLACCRLIEAIVHDACDVIPISAFLSGEYGLRDICLGVPCVINRSGIARIIELELSAPERAAFIQAAANVRRDIATL
ncbi:MAG: malate dehydrogenase [Candidatus Omnitrophota bacterium]|nr:malate dehydrogenase [Candidatus Omnitrophota bacterium]